MSAPTPQRDAPADDTDEPLPLTLRFVLVLGAVILAGWFMMFYVLQERW